MARFYKDFKVTMSRQLMTTTHCVEIVTREFRTLWALRRTFTKLKTSMFTTVYATLVRAKFEKCVQATSPRLKGNSDTVEKVQRAATRATRVYYTRSGLKS